MCLKQQGWAPRGGQEAGTQSGVSRGVTRTLHSQHLGQKLLCPRLCTNFEPDKRTSEAANSRTKPTPESLPHHALASNGAGVEQVRGPEAGTVCAAQPKPQGEEPEGCKRQPQEKGGWSSPGLSCGPPAVCFASTMEHLRGLYSGVLQQLAGCTWCWVPGLVGMACPTSSCRKNHRSLPSPLVGVLKLPNLGGEGIFFMIPPVGCQQEDNLGPSEAQFSPLVCTC